MNRTFRSLADIVRQAKTLAPDLQLQFIRDACATDESLYEHALFQLTSGAPDLEDEDSAAVGPAEWLGEIVDSYRIVRSLGQGGMGEVFLAERADDEFRQQVAIKFVRRGLLSKQAQGRLKLERQILATLDHPNIARLLGGGRTTDGTPYIVMEYVDGEALDTYCDRNRLTVTQRLELFRKICSAVHKAHQNLIVHRDLKPSNILVTRDGSPKLLDFGIAKLLDERQTAHTLAVTHADYRMLTPDHASPEQIRGEPITTASDIYVLGVLLYELLCGFKPFVIRGNSIANLERQICEHTPLAPSVAVSAATVAHQSIQEVSAARSTNPARLRRELSGDLDNIVQMAMRKEPERRYSSVEQFASDIDQYLTKQPVLARADSWSYRAGKFVRRHALMTALSSLFIAALIAFSINTYVQSQQIRKERDVATAERARAEAERERAEAVSAFLVDSFSLADPSRARGKEITAREILDSGAAHVKTELTGQPGLQATLLDTIGKVYLGLGDLKASEHLSTESLEITRSLTGDDSLDTAARLCSLGVIKYQKGEFSLAEQSFRKCLRIRTAHLGPEHPDITLPLDNLAHLAQERGDFAEAERTYRSALAIDRKTVGENHVRYVRHLQNLAAALHDQGQFDRAEPLYRQSVDGYKRLVGLQHPETIDALSNFGQLLMDKGRLKEARETHALALELNRKVRGPKHAFVGYDLASMGTIAFRQGDLLQAEQYYRESLDIYREALPSDHGYVAAALTGLGRVLIQAGEEAEAQTALERAADIWAKEYGSDSSVYAAARALLGKTWLMQGRVEEGERALTDSYPKLVSSSRANERQIATSVREWIEELYRSQNRPEAAQAFFAQVASQK